MWRAIESFSKYYFQSKSKHGIHSPFVFDFVTKALENNLDPSFYNQLEIYKNTLSKDASVISVTDFGAGSKVFKSNKRAINRIAKYAGISKTKARLLQKIIHYFQPKTILEIGTSLGIGTAAIKTVVKDAELTTLEGCPETAAVALKYLKLQGFDNINCVIGEFSKTLPDVLKNKYYDMIYLDGNHRKKPTLEYFKFLLQAVTNDSFIIFDDIHWSKEMEEAWQEIKAHPRVKVSIDLYHMGIVFFRKEQVKQDFVIRY